MSNRGLVNGLVLPLCLSLLFAVGLSIAEVSTDPPGIGTVILGIIVDEPDPVPAKIWQEFRPIGDEQYLNPEGNSRGDGPPGTYYSADGGMIVVWAWNNGADHDIAYSELTGPVWSQTEFLTTDTDNHLDPQVFMEDDGAVHVVWWTEGPVSNVYLRSRAAGSSVWDMPVLVSDGVVPARRPGVTVHDGDLMVTYEQDSSVAGMAQDVVVATRQLNGSFTVETALSTPRTDVLRPLLHSEQGHVWVDWIHGDVDFGCSERVGATWTGILVEPLTAHNWIGVEETRRLIRSQVLN